MHSSLKHFKSPNFYLLSGTTQLCIKPCWFSHLFSGKAMTQKQLFVWLRKLFILPHITLHTKKIIKTNKRLYETKAWCRITSNMSHRAGNELSPVVLRLGSFLLVFPLHLFYEFLTFGGLPHPHHHNAFVVTLIGQGSLKGW